MAGMSDDGEPPGTAGRPMLAVVLGSGVGDLAVVVRATTAARSWARAAWCAYSGGVKAVLELPVIEKVTLASLLAVGPYAWITPPERLLPEFEATIVGRTFAADVTWQLSAPAERVESLAAALVELTRGEVEVVL